MQRSAQHVAFVGLGEARGVSGDVAKSEGCEGRTGSCSGYHFSTSPSAWSRSSGSSMRPRVTKPSLVTRLTVAAESTAEWPVMEQEEAAEAALPPRT